MNLRRLARQKFGEWEKRVIPDSDIRYRFVNDRRIKWSPNCYLNNRYSVQMSIIETEEFGKVVHLWIRKHLDEPIRSWKDLMRIKNELVGENCVAVEVFPQADELVDEAHMTHLWVFEEGRSLPFGLHGDDRK